MGLKADASFLKYVTMGAKAARKTITFLDGLGFQTIELERYCTSNKIWQTKVKRLRLPDLLCVKTGARIEVRAKSKLAIRMSDAPANPDRVWDAGLRDDDVVAFLACQVDDDDIPIPADTPVFFSVEDLRASVKTTTLGPPKSAGEGAERDRTWPSTVPSADGVVQEVNDSKIIVTLSTGRRQTYQLSGKNAYVEAGEKFRGLESILAGSVPELLDMKRFSKRKWQPATLLRSTNAVDRYAAAKALPLVDDDRKAMKAALQTALSKETDVRVALEIARALAMFDDAAGVERLAVQLTQSDSPEWQMEAVLILTEVGTAAAAEQLHHVATHEAFRGSELRQAAVWGMGKRGARQYDKLLPFLSDEDDDVALHAIAAFGPDASVGTIASLVSNLGGYDKRARSSAVEALGMIGTPEVLRELVRVAHDHPSPWVMAALGRLPPAIVRPILTPGSATALQVEAVFAAVSSDENWTARTSKVKDLAFLTQQNL